MLDNVLAGILRNDGTPVAALLSYDPETVLVRADYHGVLPLLAHRLCAASGVPPALASRLHEEANRELAADIIREQEIVTALSAFADRGIVALLLKGVHLAYRWYERPDLRPRLDTDVLVAADARAEVDDVLHSLGYECPGHSTGELLTYQAAYVRRREGLLVSVFDIHWRIANPQVFGGLLFHEELASESVPVPQLGPRVRALSAVDALLLACVHRVAHHYDSDRLIWLYDIHLVASEFSPADWECFLRLVERRKVGAVCRRSLEQTVRRFHTPIPEAVLADARLCRPASHEASAAYVNPRRHVQNVMDDLAALPNWRDRIKLVREHLFPSPHYMREVYAISSRAPLPVLYAKRALRGARRWLDRVPVDNDAAEIR
ncbi:MAG: nucleotidyltransferase domain-containing protein [Vicinamibacterales bacterium]